MNLNIESVWIWPMIQQQKIKISITVSQEWKLLMNQTIHTASHHTHTPLWNYNALEN